MSLRLVLWDCPQSYIAKTLVVCPVSSPQPNTRKAASSKVHPTPPPRCSPSRAWLPCPSTCLPSQSSHHLCFQDFSFFFCPFSLVFKHSIDKRKKKENPSLNPISTSGCPLSLISLSQPNSPKSCLHRCFHSSPPFRSSTPSRQPLPAPNHPNGPNGSR